MPEIAAWAIFFLPVFSFLLIVCVIRPYFNSSNQWAGYLTIMSVSGSLVLSVWALSETIASHGNMSWGSHQWVTVGGLEVRLGIMMDSLTGIMLVVVTGVSLMVQIYSQGYMHGDSGYARYYALMSLFTASMLGLVMSSSIIQMYVFWELVGASSYLLIGFWYHRPSASRAAVKAFLVTRLGDLGFLLAILYLFSNQDLFALQGMNSLEVKDINAVAGAGILGNAAVTWIAMGIFAGAAGKSAQFPLHVWLPDAMEGPTPVSALIHAATMVAAGVFLVARFFPIFEASSVAMDLVAIIGAFTAIFAASIGLVMYDIKRVIAYSTISQLGYMIMALGVGGYPIAIFHLFTHAFFKALLFLGSGSVHHAVGTFDMRYMGGLRQYQPWTYATFIIGGLSLAGIFPLAGFWSKDEILAQAFARGGGLGLVVSAFALVTVIMTAFYIFRVVFMVFHGSFKGGVEREEELRGIDVRSVGKVDGPPTVTDPNQGSVHLGESPFVMIGPMLVLAAMSIGGGFLANSPWGYLGVPAHWITSFLALPGGHSEVHSLNIILAAISTGLAIGGIGLAWLMHRGNGFGLDTPSALRIRVLLTRKYYFDELYETVITQRLFYRTICGALDWVDRNLVDGLVELIGLIGRNVGRGMAPLQTGQLQFYGTVFSVGILIIVVVFQLRG